MGGQWLAGNSFAMTEGDSHDQGTNERMMLWEALAGRAWLEEHAPPGGPDGNMAG